MNEYETEPVRGLPEQLPADERILWQGAPRWQGLARHAFHANKVAFYFGLLVVIHMATHLNAGEGVVAVARGAAWLALLGLTAVGLLGLMGWLYARTSVYTLTDKRLVLRIGVAIPMMVNIPLNRVDGARLRTYGDGSGNIALTTSPNQRVSHWVVWPHARPWHYAPAQPMLRDIPDAAAVAETLAIRLRETAPGSIPEGGHAPSPSPARSAAHGGAMTAA